MIGLCIELVCWFLFPRTNSITFIAYLIATVCLLYAARIIPTIEIRRTSEQPS